MIKIIFSFLFKMKKCYGYISFFCIYFLFFFFFLLYFTLQYCIGFAIHWHESSMGVYAFPNMNIIFLKIKNQIKNKAIRLEENSNNFIGLRHSQFFFFFLIVKSQYMKLTIFLKSSLYLLQYYLCFNRFWFIGNKACGILAPH